MQAISLKKPQIVAVLGTGGTIAGTARAGLSRAEGNVAYTSAQLGVEALLEAIPGLGALALEVQAEQVAQVDSKDMGFEIWKNLALRVAHHLERPECAGVVITHGTDTLEETAYFLHRVLPSTLLQTKPVVITCAMRPATSPEADGPQNMLDAFRLAIGPGACGVLAVCAGQIHAALHVQKVHPYRLDAFDSGDAGALGQIRGGQVEMALPWPMPEPDQTAVDLADLALLQGWPRVEIVLSHSGANGRLVDVLTAERSAPSASYAKGIVVAGTGNGTVHEDLQSALVRAQGAGIRVWRSTRCAYGAVQGVPDHVLPEVSTLSPVKARIALALALLPQSPLASR